MNLSDKFENDKLNEWCGYVLKYDEVCDYEG